MASQRSIANQANSRMVINLLHWGTGVVLDKSNATEIAPILKPIHDVVTLTNDYFSWEKEIAEHIELNEATPLINSVAFYMKWDSLSATDAKAAVKAKIQQLEEEYSALKTEYIARHGDKTPSSVIRWFSIMEAVVAGNLIWSNFTPRYHVSNIKAHEYEEYYARRIREGASFFDSCTESDAFIPPVSQETTSTRHSRVDCINGGPHESTKAQNAASDKTSAAEDRQDQKIVTQPSAEASHKRKRRGSVDARQDSAMQQHNSENATPPPESDLGSHLDTQKKQRKANGVSRDHKEGQNGDTPRKVNGHMNHHNHDAQTGSVNGESQSDY